MQAAAAGFCLLFLLFLPVAAFHIFVFFALPATERRVKFTHIELRSRSLGQVSPRLGGSFDFWARHREEEVFQRGELHTNVDEFPSHELSLNWRRRRPGWTGSMTVFHHRSLPAKPWADLPLVSCRPGNHHNTIATRELMERNAVIRATAWSPPAQRDQRVACRSMKR